jgi:hypothetical protein
VRSDGRRPTAHTRRVAPVWSGARPGHRNRSQDCDEVVAQYRDTSLRSRVLVDLMAGVVLNLERLGLTRSGSKLA